MFENHDYNQYKLQNMIITNNLNCILYCTVVLLYYQVTVFKFVLNYYITYIHICQIRIMHFQLQSTHFIQRFTKEIPHLKLNSRTCIVYKKNTFGLKNLSLWGTNSCDAVNILLYNNIMIVVKSYIQNVWLLIQNQLIMIHGLFQNQTSYYII